MSYIFNSRRLRFAVFFTPTSAHLRIGRRALRWTRLPGLMSWHKARAVPGVPGGFWVSPYVSRSARG